MFMHHRAWGERPVLPRGARWAEAQGKTTPAGPGIIEPNEQLKFTSFPCHRTQLPVTRCEICQRTVAYRPGALSEALTEHYRRAHPEALGLPAQ